MPFDAGFVNYLVEEMQVIVNSKINEIFFKKNIYMFVLNKGNEKKLLFFSINLDNANYGIYLDYSPLIEEENSLINNKLFVLKNKIENSKISSIKQINCDRIIEIEVEKMGKFSNKEIFKIFIEFGNTKNIILTDSNNKILFTNSEYDLNKRAIFVGREYELPYSEKKDLNWDEFQNIMSSEHTINEIKKNLVGKFNYIFPEMFNNKELKGFFENEIMLENKEKIKDLYIIFEKFINKLLIKNKKNFILLSNNYITWWDDDKESNSFETAIDACNYLQNRIFMENEKKEKYAKILKIIDVNLKKLEKKMEKITSEKKQYLKYREYNILGDLIMANIWKKYDSGIDKIEVENFYNNNKKIIINLMPNLSLHQNAERYYKLYRKSINGIKLADENIDILQRRINCLLNFKEKLNENKDNLFEMEKIYHLLEKEDYIPKENSNKKLKRNNLPNYKIYFCNNWRIVVGKGAKENEFVTFQIGKAGDLWFHTKDIPGAHVIIKKDGKKEEIPEEIINYAARLAATFSKAKGSTKVPVDFTDIKNVRRPSQYIPGLVIYDEQKTIYAEPFH